ncbi:AIM24 family protein [Rubrimonas cliftonensis]|uniref:Uncharacterized conserved protein, AIM24 family n=1 Tax=Rubrimonas cliftonensis TaxID=89524 RepID=A0A1H3YZG0_9RHOB|nr:AIM24 family protein [Rubrimonas cliftonensis]SEA16826.1 Uncharacterized conserved protein, AIM24 family [Rubrimonas cliftonensis]
MARFTVRDVEGMRQLRIDLAGETVRTVRGALSRLEGDIRMTAPLPGPGTLLRSMISREGAVRPRYTGSGAVHLQPSMRGYHVFEAREMRWILEPGVFWAAEGDVRLGLRLERIVPSLFAGDGLFKLQTTVVGEGKVVINAPGPVEEVAIDDAEILVKGRLVLGRTDGLRFSTKRPGGLIRALIAGEPLARAYRGTGKLLVCWTPYWNQYIHDMMNPDLRPSSGLWE